MRVEFFVAGKPQSQGSLKAIALRRRDGRPILDDRGGQRIVLVDHNAWNKPWRTVVATVAQQHIAEDQIAVDGPVMLTLEFRMPAPKTAKRGALPIVFPDLDKLVRSVLDALTGVAYKDDKQVTDIDTSKRYAFDSQPGVHITVETGLHATQRLI